MITRFFQRTKATRTERIVSFGVVATVALVAMVLFRHHPTSIAGMPECPSKSVLGLECPGCGSTRATHFLLNAKFAAAWRHNPALVVLGVPAFLAFLVDALSTLLFGTRRVFRLPPKAGIAIAAALVFWMIARNLPYAAFDAWRPPPPPPPPQ